MSVVSAIAIYFLIWWLCLFAVLPFGVKAQDEIEGEVVPGTPTSAPDRPMIIRKMLVTTAISAVIFALLAAVYQSGAVSLDSIPFLPKF